MWEGSRSDGNNDGGLNVSSLLLPDLSNITGVKVIWNYSNATNSITTIKKEDMIKGKRLLDGDKNIGSITYLPTINIFSLALYEKFYYVTKIEVL